MSSLPDDAKHLGAAPDEEAVAEVLLERAAKVLVLDLEAALRILERLVHPRVLERDGAERAEALEQRDRVGSEFVGDGMGIDVEHAEHAPRAQDRERHHGAKRQLADALPVLEERGADGVGHPHGLAAMGRFLGDAPGDLEFVRRERALVLVSRDLEVELSVLAHEHEEPAIGVRDLNHGIDDPDEKLVEIERACDRARCLEDVRDAV